MIQEPIFGYRAPCFSITPGCEWAFDALAKLGFSYDSSVHPVHHPTYGNPTAPRSAYPVAHGQLMEFPIATWRVAGRNLSVGGGAYLRLLPYQYIQRGLAAWEKDMQSPAMLYLHPWEIDPYQPHIPLSFQSTVRQTWGTTMMEDKLQRLLNQFQFAPVRDTHKGVLDGKGYSPQAIHISVGRSRGAGGWMNDEIRASTTSNSFDFTGAAIRHVIHPLWAKARIIPPSLSYMREFERNQYLHPDDLRKLQMRRLRQQLIDAYRYVPFYRHRMTQAGLTPLDIRTHEDLRLLPVLTKRDIQDHQDLLVSSNVPPSKRQQNQTGGSTGSPLQFFVDVERLDSRMASAARHNYLGRITNRRLVRAPLGFAVRCRRHSRPEPSLAAEISLSQSIASHGCRQRRSDDALRRSSAEISAKDMVAYAQSAVLFAEFCTANNIHDITFESMIVSAEMLLPGKRANPGRNLSRQSVRSLWLSRSQRHRQRM